MHIRAGWLHIQSTVRRERRLMKENEDISTEQQGLLCSDPC